MLMLEVCVYSPIEYPHFGGQRSSEVSMNCFLHIVLLRHVLNQKLLGTLMYP